MNEDEAINSLMQDLLGETQEAPQSEKAEAVQESPKAEQAEPSKDLPDIKAMLAEQSKMIAELKANQEEKQSKQEVKEQLTAEQMQEQQVIADAQQKLGITQLLQQQEAQRAEAERSKQFQAESAKFKKTHPDVSLDELAQWAQGNGYEQVLGMGAKGWQLIAGAMQAQAKPVSKPDAVTPSSSQGAEPNAFDKIKKGEKVSDIDVGLDILKFSGL